MSDILFSVIIPTYNAKGTLSPLLKQIIKLTPGIPCELLVIDSSSTDGTMRIIKEYTANYSFIKFLQIPLAEFNHGLTRNYGVKNAKGKYIVFFTQDVLPVTHNLFSYILEDFKINSRVMAVFGKQIPYKDTPFIQKIDDMCTFEKFDNCVNKQGIFLQDPSHSKYIKNSKEEFIWYALFNSFSVYNREFLLKHPFEKVEFGEDLLLGKELIYNNYCKVYDSRCVVKHSHIYTFRQWFERHKKDSYLKSKLANLKTRSNIKCKVNHIINSNENVLIKCKYLLELFIYYAAKGYIKFSMNFVK